MAPNPCLGCGTPLTCATALERGARPSEGCITICQSCGHLQAFGKDLKFRALTDEEIIEVAGEPVIVAANTVRGPLRDFWKHDDGKGAYEFMLANIRKDITRARRR